MAKVARLLDQIVPERYQLHFDVDMEKFRYGAEETIDFELKQPGRELVFHAIGLNVEQAELESKLEATGIQVSKDDETVTFTFAEAVPAGHHKLNVKFSGEIQDSLHGFYRSKYMHDGQEKWLATTQFEAIHAREAFVAIDEPAAKAVFELTMTVPEQLTVIANTNATDEQSAGGRKTVTFAPTPKMSTYLVAFVVGELEFVEAKTPEDVTVRVYATPGRTGQLVFALETAVRALSFYNQYFDIPYPLPKLDMISVPDFSVGAMENWGLVTYRETSLLLDPEHTSLSNKQRVAEVVLHELAHQWFGNLVTMAWWNDLWLNEGFATWMEVFTMDKLFPEWQQWTEFVSSTFAYSMELDGLANTHSIEVEIENPRGLDEVFDAVSYYKGASIINMLHHYIGAEQFQKGLQAYLKRHSYNNAVTTDLWQALGGVSGKPVGDVMSAWTSRPGYPLVSFEEGELRQRRFYSSPREAAKARGNEQTWPIPFDVLLDSGTETQPLLVSEPSAPMPDEAMRSTWFKPNPGQTGFYRSLYTQPMIEALTKPLQDGELGPVDRFGVVNDVFAAIEAGELDSATGLKLVEALRNESNFVVWQAVIGGLASIQNVLEDEGLRERLDRFGEWLVQPNLERLGWRSQPDEPAFDTLMRPVVLQQAARYGTTAVIEEARRQFSGYLKGGEIDPNLRAAILFAVARYGSDEEFETMLERYDSEQVPQVKMSFLAALGRFRKPELIQRFLDMGLSEKVRPQDIFYTVAYGFGNREGRGLAWTWVKQNWNTFVERYGAGGHMLERFPNYAGSAFSTLEKAKEIGEFFTAHPHPGTARPTAQAVEAVELKADWRERDQAKIEKFLNEWEASQK